MKKVSNKAIYKWGKSSSVTTGYLSLSLVVDYPISATILLGIIIESQFFFSYSIKFVEFH